MDAALPRFSIADSSNSIKHHNSIFLRRPHSEPEPAYAIHHADPSTQASQNCYASGLVDAYNEQVLFGEVMIEPKWTFPTLSAEAIRLNGGVPPPPEPIMPTEFTIQLYNPDQQVLVSKKDGGLVGGSKWEFSLPVDVFRMPSVSALDRAQNDPIASETTPKVNFAWRKENKFSKELTCYVTGKSTDAVSKKRSKEPDIAIAIFRSLREITIYEPNLSRVELEDPKGLEVVIILGAAVIRDVYFGKDIRNIFNITEPPRRDSAASQAASPGPVNGAGAAVAGLYTQSRIHAQSVPTIKQPNSMLRQSPGPPPMDPRTQWEMDAETKRLETDERARRKEEERLRREREKAADEETRRLRKMVEAEDRARREREKQVEEETTRLQKIYGVQLQQALPPMMSGGIGPPSQSNSAPVSQGPFPPPQTQTQTQNHSWFGRPVQQAPPPQPSYQQQPPPQNWVPHSGYQQQFSYPPPQPRQSSLLPPNNQSGQSSSSSGRRRSFLNLTADGPEKLRKKRSSIF